MKLKREEEKQESDGYNNYRLGTLISTSRKLYEKRFHELFIGVERQYFRNFQSE
jgi:hypothetical protein